MRGTRWCHPRRETADLDLRQPQPGLRILGGDAVVARQRELERAPSARPLMAAAHGLPLVSMARNTSEDLRLSSNSIWLAATSPLALSNSVYRRFMLRASTDQRRRRSLLARVTTTPLTAASRSLFHDLFQFGHRGFVEHVHRTAGNVPCHQRNAVGVGLNLKFLKAICLLPRCRQPIGAAVVSARRVGKGALRAVPTIPVRSCLAGTLRFATLRSLKLFR